MNNEMSQAQQAYNIYTNLTGQTCSIVEICLKAGGIPESLRTEDGHVEAQYYMGLYYERGYSVQKDFTEAIKWYRKAAEQGHADAQFRLGVCYYIGEGVDKSTEEAIKYCRKAAEKGHQMAKEMLEYMDQQLG
jgi:TPR repeat protein